MGGGKPLRDPLSPPLSPPLDEGVGPALANLVPLVLLKIWSECLESGSNDADYDVPGTTGHQGCFPPGPSGGDCWCLPLWQRIGDQTQLTALPDALNCGIHNVFMIHVDDLLFAGSIDGLGGSGGAH